MFEIRHSLIGLEELICDDEIRSGLKSKLTKSHATIFVEYQVFLALLVVCLHWSAIREFSQASLWA